MNPEEKKALLDFMGTVYGATSKLDRDIVGSSGNLQPISQQIKQQFEQTLYLPTDNSQQATSTTAAVVEVAPVGAPFVPYISPTVVTKPESPPPVTNFNKEIVDQLKDINLNLSQIVNILKPNNVKANNRTKTRVKE
jgi:hypothetical protein